MVAGTIRRRLLTTMALSVLLICTLLTVWPAPASADAGDLPPRPTIEEVKSSPVGGFIRLQVAFPQSWSWNAYPWQMTHTQVQWKTAEDEWVNVAGWYGALDSVDVAADGSVSGTKTWWVAPRDFGAGPFRWLITTVDSQSPLAASEPFTLPARHSNTVKVAISLPK